MCVCRARLGAESLKHAGFSRAVGEAIMRLLIFRSRELVPQQRFPVAYGPGGGRAVLGPDTFGLRVEVPVLLPVAFPQEGAVGGQGES